MSFALAVLFAASTLGPAGLAQSALDAIDSDTVCFAAFAMEANAKEKSGAPDSLVESAAGYFLGRMAANSRDSGAALLADMTRLDRLPENKLQSEKSACMKRYMKSLLGMQSVLNQISAVKK